MPASTLYPGEQVFDETNWQVGLGPVRQVQGIESVVVNGEVRYLSATPKPEGFDDSGFAAPFGDVYPDYPQSEWDARIDEQIELEARCSDFCDFPAFDQDGLPTCWAIGTAQAGSIARRIQGLPHVQLSGCSLAVPISGGHRGGWEGDAVEFMAKNGACSVAVWPENNTSRSLISSAAVAEDRKFHMAAEFLSMRTKANWVSACLRTKCGPFAFNWMRHVMCMCDVVRIEAGSYGFRVRNSWSNGWGVKNKHGYGGFATYRQTPDSGYAINQMRASEK